MNPALLFRKMIGALNRWFEKAEQEEEEYRREILKPLSKEEEEQADPPPPVGASPDSVARAPAPEQPDDRLKPPATGSIPPPPPKIPPPPPEKEGQPPVPRAHGIAGLSENAPRSDRKGAVRISQNDTEWEERNERVEKIHEHYGRFGDRVAAAVLSRVMGSGGVSGVLAKLGLESLGGEDRDHRQIVAFIDREGLDEFAARLNIPSARLRQSPAPAVPRRESGSVRPRVRKKEVMRNEGAPDSGASMRLRTPGMRPVRLDDQNDTGKKTD